MSPYERRLKHLHEDFIPYCIHTCPAITHHVLISDSYILKLTTIPGGITVDPTITLSEDYDFSDSSPRFQLICISYGSPTATWARDSSYLSTGSTTTISTSGPTIAFIHTLTVTEKLGGVYTCTAAGGSPPTNSASFYIQGL